MSFRSMKYRAVVEKGYGGSQNSISLAILTLIVRTQPSKAGINSGKSPICIKLLVHSIVVTRCQVTLRLDRIDLPSLWPSSPSWYWASTISGQNRLHGFENDGNLTRPLSGRHISFMII